MSANTYITEPETTGKVILETTIGPLDLELWAKYVATVFLPSLHVVLGQILPLPFIFIIL